MASASNSASAGFAPVYWLAVGTFAVGTEGFMIAGLLPTLARDLNVGLVAAGHLVTAFSLAYAIGAPVMAVLTARLDEGTPCEPGTIIGDVRGPARALLTGERVALNFLQRLSGIATATA